MRMPVPAHWAEQSDPDWINGTCVVCGRKTAKHGLRYVRYDLEEHVLNSEGGNFSRSAPSVRSESPLSF